MSKDFDVSQEETGFLCCKTNASLQKAFINPLEPCGVLFIMEDALYFASKSRPCKHYKAWKSQDIFNITHYIRPKE